MPWDVEEWRVAHSQATCHMQAPGIKNTAPAHGMQRIRMWICASIQKMTVIKTALMIKQQPEANRIISQVNSVTFRLVNELELNQSINFH